MLSKHYKFYQDDAHGWLAVPITEVREVGIKVTGYSYCKGGMLYLEEDCDGSAFAYAWERATGKQWEPGVTYISIHHPGSSPIRSYHDPIPPDLLQA